MRRFYGYYNLKKGVILFYPLGGDRGVPPLYPPDAYASPPLNPPWGIGLCPLPPSAYALPPSTQAIQEIRFQYWLVKVQEMMDGLLTFIVVFFSYIPIGQTESLVTKSNKHQRFQSINPLLNSEQPYRVTSPVNNEVLVNSLMNLE